MTRIAIDAATALEIIRRGSHVPDDVRLVSASRLRSEALSSVYRAARAGTLDAAAVADLLDGITALPIRLLGDRVSRQVAYRLADELGLDDTPPAEYLAVAKLQADALITVDADLAALARGIVDVAPFEEVFGARCGAT
jgi:hypothetical protein